MNHDIKKKGSYGVFASVNIIQDYYGINVIAVLDVVDYEKSKYIKFKSSNRIMLFTKYAFRVCDELKKQYIFKLVDEPRKAVFASKEVNAP